MYRGIEQRPVVETQCGKVGIGGAVTRIVGAEFRPEMERTGRIIIGRERALVFRNLLAVDKEFAVSVLTALPDGRDHVPHVRRELIGRGAMRAVLVVDDEVQSFCPQRLPPSLRTRKVAFTPILPTHCRQGMAAITDCPGWLDPHDQCARTRRKTVARIYFRPAILVGMHGVNACGADQTCSLYTENA